jgi:acetyl-CoA carboxylase biotin carboxyl carrier protein
LFRNRAGRIIVCHPFAMPPSKRPARDEGEKPTDKNVDKSIDKNIDRASDKPGDAADEIFDIERVRRLVELMKEHDLNEVELRGGDRRIRLRRGQEAASGPFMVASSAPAAAPSPSSEKPKGGAAVEAVAESATIAYIKSPMVGTFYSRPNPNSPPFVKPGDHVNPDTTVCIVEAMKVFNEIAAEQRGRIVAVLVAEGEAVDHGKPLFKIDTAG